MNPQDIRDKLREAGIPVDGGWSRTEGKITTSPLVEKQKETLRKLEGLVRKQIETDMDRVSELHVALRRIKHGGGS